MQIYTAAEAKLKKAEIQSRIARGQIFIHPTDTIYGLGCSAKLSKAVKKIREIKQRPDTPFSIMVPSVEWIKENCVISKEAEKYLKQLPGPITLILKTKNHPVAKEVAPGKDSVGVRIPDHWFHKIVEDLGVPIITTSVNVTGKIFMTSLENLDNEIRKKVDFAIDEGEKKGRPSKIIHLEGEEVKVRER
ncbi:threonylcarbamoyl-AMP synthase [Candidatus Woesearchaeota archaeon]|nr:threonylcarbamoyl-AMP synthase [Candidatus Woesearchaeota archaeon]